MQETRNNINYDDEEIDFLEIVNILWAGKRFIFFFTTFISILGILYSLNLPNIYTSKAILSPADTSNSISRSLESYAGLAGLAGVTLPSSSESDNSTKALSKLDSLSFFERSILPNIFLPNLMAVESWNPEKNTVNYDKDIYNEDSNTWVRKYTYPRKQIPSAQESFKVFTKKHLAIGSNKTTSFVTVSIKHQSPYIAKKWIEIIVDEINAHYRENDKLDSEKAISYLNKQIALTNLTEVRQAISEIIQDETRKLALIEAKEYYVFEYIDPPAVMELKSEPKRSMICILFAFIGGILSVIYLLIKYFIFRDRTPNQ